MPELPIYVDIAHSCVDQPVHNTDRFLGAPLAVQHTGQGGVKTRQHRIEPDRVAKCRFRCVQIAPPGQQMTELIIHMSIGCSSLDQSSKDRQRLFVPSPASEHIGQRIVKARRERIELDRFGEGCFGSIQSPCRSSKWPSSPYACASSISGASGSAIASDPSVSRLCRSIALRIWASPSSALPSACNNRPKATLPTTDLGEVSTAMRSILTAALRSVCCSRNPLNSSSFHSWVI